MSRNGKNYLPKIKSLFAVSAISASVSSPGADFCRMVLPHFSHLWVIMNPSDTGDAAIGRMQPPHSAARSPGLLSTCMEHKQLGQWFVYPLPVTLAPQ